MHACEDNIANTIFFNTDLATNGITEMLISAWFYGWLQWFPNYDPFTGVFLLKLAGYMIHLLHKDYYFISCFIVLFTGLMACIADCPFYHLTTVQNCTCAKQLVIEESMIYV